MSATRAQVMELSSSQLKQLEKETLGDEMIHLSSEAMAAGLQIQPAERTTEVTLPAMPSRIFQSKKSALLHYIQTTTERLEQPLLLDIESIGHLARGIHRCMSVIRKSENLGQSEKRKLRNWALLVAEKLSRSSLAQYSLQAPGAGRPSEATFKNFEYWLLKNGIIRTEIFKDGDRDRFRHPYDAAITKRMSRQQARESGDRVRKYTQYLCLAIVIASILTTSALVLLNR